MKWGKWSLKNHRPAILLKTSCCLSYLQIQMYFCHFIPKAHSKLPSWPFHLVGIANLMHLLILWVFLLRLSLATFLMRTLGFRVAELQTLYWGIMEPDTCWGHPLCSAWLLGSWGKSLSWEIRGNVLKWSPGKLGHLQENREEDP